jgi:hypothetical protein
MEGRAKNDSAFNVHVPPTKRKEAAGYAFWYLNQVQKFPESL